MMNLIVNQSGDMMLNLEQCCYLYVGEDCTVKAIVAEGQRMVRMGSYTDYACACTALARAIDQLRGGSNICRFAPADEILKQVVQTRDPAPNKFAANGKKPTRRGGS